VYDCDAKVGVLVVVLPLLLPLLLAVVLTFLLLTCTTAAPSCSPK